MYLCVITKYKYTFTFRILTFYKLSQNHQNRNCYHRRFPMYRCNISLLCLHMVMVLPSASLSILHVKIKLKEKKRHNTKRCSVRLYLQLFVGMSVNVLLMLFVFVCAQWCPTNIAFLGFFAVFVVVLCFVYMLCTLCQFPWIDHS